MCTWSGDLHSRLKLWCLCANQGGEKWELKGWSGLEQAARAELESPALEGLKKTRGGGIL